MLPIGYNKEEQMYEIEIYRDKSGKVPFIEWNLSLDTMTAAKIDARLARFRDTGHLGKCEPVGGGVFELKFDFGPGYRVYFGYYSKDCLVVLWGGNKKSQQKDINKAKEYWSAYLSLKGEKR